MSVEKVNVLLLSTAVGAAGAKVAVGFTVRDGAAPVEPTEITRVSFRSNDDRV